MHFAGTAVVIGSPMPFHVAQSIAALENGIDVLCEVTAGCATSLPAPPQRNFPPSHLDFRVLLTHSSCVDSVTLEECKQLVLAGKFCIKSDEFCIKNMNFVSKKMNFVFKMMTFVLEMMKQAILSISCKVIPGDSLTDCLVVAAGRSDAVYMSTPLFYRGPPHMRNDASSAQQNVSAKYHRISTCQNHDQMHP